MSLCPVSLSTIEDELDGICMSDILISKLDYYIDRVECRRNIISIDEHINVLFMRYINDEIFRRQIQITEEHNLLDKEIIGFSTREGKKHGTSIEPLFELAEILNSDKNIGLVTEAPKSVYFAVFGLRCISFYENKRDLRYMFEAYRSLGFAEQMYLIETPVEIREKEKIESKKKAAKAKDQKTYEPLRNVIRKINEVTDWEKELTNVNFSQKADYIIPLLEKEIKDAGLYDPPEGVQKRWVEGELKKIINTTSAK